MTNDELAQLVLEATDGLMLSMQLLVMSLDQTGHLDRPHLARLLAQARNDLAPDGFQADVLDRFLAFPAEEPEALRRRLAMRVVASPSAPPTP